MDLHDHALEKPAPTGGSLRSLSDDELLRRLSEVVGRSRRIEMEIVSHIGEVDARRLYAREACDSMFTYCTAVLRLSEHEAYLRITVARVARRHPLLLAMLADGRLHLSGIAKLAAHLTEANRDSVLGRAIHKSKREIEVLVADLAPRPDVPVSVRRLPDRAQSGLAGSVDRRSHEVRLAGCGAEPHSLPEAGHDQPRSMGEPGPDRVAGAPAHACPPAASLAARTSGRSARVEPLAPSRYKVQFTASAAFCEKIDRLKALMRSSVPDGDLARLLEAAVSETLERLERRRFGMTRAPRRRLIAKDRAPHARNIPAAVRRAVYGRDGGRCRFVDDRGRRCAARDNLEYHHVVPRARGGDRSVENIRLTCRTHNVYLAECDYGRPVMEQYRRGPRDTSEPRDTFPSRPPPAPARRTAR
ncbi:MAG TPA: HNH endonuclease [Vicinamibacteria bacterium]|nr:HNH endonuclease [Vicinamibacteria bacterium]